jgi:predicted signal transduction protein with EAL and GGDEF domain
LKLGVDIIKIDKMFVDALGLERYSRTIIETLVELAMTMKMKVVAEGVETFDQVEYLRTHGVHAGLCVRAAAASQFVFSDGDGDGKARSWPGPVECGPNRGGLAPRL